MVWFGFKAKKPNQTETEPGPLLKETLSLKLNIIKHRLDEIYYKSIE